jgi:HEPN domain-containing protein
LDAEEFGRWFEGAAKTLVSAERDVASGDFNWACFKAHQAVEKALKALLWGVGKPAFGHSLIKLVDKVFEVSGGRVEWVADNCMRLDKYYTATRYPDVWESGFPEEYFSRGEAEEALDRAAKVVEWVKAVWASLSKGG